MTNQVSRESVGPLMKAFRGGDKQAADELVRIFYPELHRLANRRFRGERIGHSWQPTLLVNELYLELVKIKALPRPEEDDGEAKASFFGLAAQIMCRLLIHHSRPAGAKAIKLPFEEQQPKFAHAPVVEIESMLSRLEAIRPRLRAIVELKVFEGMTLDEIASQLKCSTATITREWSFARHLLRKEMGL